MTDDNRTPSGGARAGYGSPSGPRYQPRSLVTSHSGDTARSARAVGRSGSGKKEILCAFGIDVDAVAGWLGSYGGENSPCDISRGLFAGEVGVPRLVKLFDRLGIRTSWFIPGHSIETFPEQCKLVVDAGHEIGMHGYSHENPISMTPEQEERVMDKCIELIERLSGKRPTGYVAPWWEFSNVTNELLLKKGIKYDHSLMNNDFHPFYVRVGDNWTLIDYSKHPDEWMKPLVRGEETDLIDIPGSWYLDDLPPMMFIKSAPNSHGFVKPRDIEELWCDQFDWVYREYDYAVFAMTIHPDVSGRPQVLLMLERVFDYFQACGREVLHLRRDRRRFPPPPSTARRFGAGRARPIGVQFRRALRCARYAVFWAARAIGAIAPRRPRSLPAAPSRRRAAASDRHARACSTRFLKATASS
jgi:peptidoglycan-N-acetylglucosamine deacetylase